MAAVAVAGAVAVRELVTDTAPTSIDARVERVGSEPLGAATAEPVAGPPATWRLRFRVAAAGTDSTEIVVVRAPFDSHTDVRVGGEVREERETALGLSVARTTSRSLVALSVAPEAAGFRPGPVMAGAVERGLVEPRERRRVAGRACRVYRTSADHGGSTFTPGWTTKDHVDVCIDEGTGLLLELVEVFEGKLLRQRVALDVDLDVEVEAAALTRLPHERTIAAAQGGGSFRPVDAGTQPVGPFLVADAPPAGFVLLGRFEVIPPQPDIARPESRGRVVAAVSDVFVRGPDVVVIERGARLDQSRPWEPNVAFPDVDLGSAGVGELVVGITGAEVRALLGSGRFVRVYGTVTVDELVAVARGLRVTEGGTGPDYLDD